MQGDFQLNSIEWRSGEEEPNASLDIRWTTQL